MPLVREINSVLNIPMFERYTEKARRAIFFARYEASQYGSPYIETEHLLLGLMRECRAVLGKWFPGKGNLEAKIRTQIEKHITRGARIPTSVEVPLSQENRQVLMLAADAADKLGHPLVGPEHLLIGILCIEKCLAAQVLRAQGATPGPIQEALAKMRYEKRESGSPPRAFLTLEYFLEGLKTLSAEELMHHFANNAEFVDGLGERWDRAAIGKEFESLFAPYAKRNVDYILEGALAETDQLSVYTVLWKNALLASEERAWMHRMTIMLKLEDAGWKILFAQVTLVKPFSASAS